MDTAISKAHERLNFVTQNKEFLRNYHRRQMEMSDWITGINTAIEKNCIQIAKKALSTGYHVEAIQELT